MSEVSDRDDVSGSDGSTRRPLAGPIAVPDEDPGFESSRYEAWQRERNPGGSDSGNYLVRMAVRASVRLDRAAIVHDARIAKFARDAVQARAEGRGRAVDELAILLETDCAAAARRLKTTSEGCDWLIREWGLLLQTLVEPAQWDFQDQRRASRLLGIASIIRDQSPAVLAIETHAICDARRLVIRLEANLWPETVDWALRYNGPWAKEEDEVKLADLAPKAAAGRATVLARIEAELASLEAIKADLAASEAIDRAEATYRDRFDATPAGTLLLRYQADAERTILRMFKELRESEKGETSGRKEGKASGRP